MKHYTSEKWQTNIRSRFSNPPKYSPALIHIMIFLLVLFAFVYLLLINNLISTTSIYTKQSPLLPNFTPFPLRMCNGVCLVCVVPIHLHGFVWPFRSAIWVLLCFSEAPKQSARGVKVPNLGCTCIWTPTCWIYWDVPLDFGAQNVKVFRFFRNSKPTKTYLLFMISSWVDVCHLSGACKV